MIPFVDLKPSITPIRTDIDAAMRRVVDRGVFLNGPEVEAFEAEWAAYCGARYCVACASGTDALAIIAACAGQDAFSIQANTCEFTKIGLHKELDDSHRTVEAIDCDNRGYADANYNWNSIEDVGLAVPVETLLYGRMTRCLSGGIVDACQAHGWEHTDCSFAAWSFYPTKNLGCYGDGGAVTTNEYSGMLRAIAAALPSRLSELNAAVLRTKLPHLDSWNAERLKLAEAYWNELPDWCDPVCRPGEPSNHHIFAILVDRRDELEQHLLSREIGVKCHYREPLANLPGAVRWCSRILSLPLWVGMTPEQVRTVCDTIKVFNADNCIPRGAA